MRKITLLAIILSITTVSFSQNAPAKSDSIVTDTILPFQRQELKEVKVVARKRLIEQKIDKMVVNVDAAVTNAGTTAMDVLEKSPGIQVDKDGNISLKGKQGVMVMIDGRPTYLTGAELANLLRGMESSQLEQIEIMTNPPAKYDAGGNSGVINIKTKKNKLKGFNGSVSANIGQGKYSKMNENLSLNYRNNKFNLFGNFSHGRYNNFNQLNIYRRYKNEDETTRAIFEQVSFNRNTSNNYNAKIGLDYYLAKKTTLGIVASGFTNPSDVNGFNTSFLKNPQSAVDSIVESRTLTDQRWSNGTVNLNMRHAFDSTGRELTADLDYVQYDVTNTQTFTNTSFTPTMVKQFEDRLIGDLPMKISIYSAKTDYTHPIKDGKIEAGLKTSYVDNDSRANYFNVIGNDASYDYTKTNYFRYKENINAAYINFNRKLSKKFEMQTGLRFENTNYSGLQWGNPTQTDSSFDRSYNGLFPTVYVKYMADSSNQFAVSFGRRIERPRYEDLNPFLFFIDKYTYGRGNPYLLPQYSNNIELSHTFKGFLTTTLNYGYTKNMFSDIFDQEGSYATIVTNGNIGRRINMGISMSAQIPVAKWMNSNVYANYNYDKLNGKLIGEDFEVSAGNFTVNVNNQLTFGKGWSGEVSGWYRSKGIWGQIKSYPMGALNAGISKQVLKEKGSVKIAVRDILYTQPPKGDINFKSTEAHFSSLWDSRQVNITFNYRFGKPFKVDGPRRRESRPEEQNRVKGAGN